MILLGWPIDTCGLLLRLPLDKFDWWRKECRELLADPKILRVALESLIWKLLYAAYVIPLSHHFLSRFWAPLAWMKEKKIEYPVRISKDEIEDVRLCDILLEKTHEGIFMNGLVLQNSTHIGFSDSCLWGLGGFTHRGRGWRLKLNPALAAHSNDISNNVSKFLGMAITLWLSLIECKDMGLVNELILILGDNTSAIHWIIRSSLPKTSIYCSTVLFIARRVAILVLGSKNFIMLQHLPGIIN